MTDEDYMRAALELARQGWEAGEVPVGALVVCGGEVVGRGYNQPISSHDPTAHAEVMALRDAAEHGHSVRGATVVVTLEPCAHHGRTGPCCDALAAAGIGRVVAALTDPNPQVAGQGMARLAASARSRACSSAARVRCRLTSFHRLSPINCSCSTSALS